MKRISITHLRASTQWHAILEIGRVDGSGQFILIEDADAPRFTNLEFEEVIEIQAPLPVPLISSQDLNPISVNPIRTLAEIERLEAICATCQWNFNWICQHIGCLPCKQAREGGLKQALRFQNHICPAGKH
jgi:hypothetical protein